MENTQLDLLPENLIEGTRDKVIPAWIRMFAWLFLALGSFALLGLIFGIFGYRFSMALYGLETSEPLSIVGLSLFGVFIFKGIVAYGLLLKTASAIQLAIIDGIIGIAICLFVMFAPLIYPEFRQGGLFRLELLALIPYLLKLRKVKSRWEAIIEK